MQLQARDTQIVRLVGRFGQLTSGQVARLVFSDVSSPTPCNRALNRLVASGFLARIERRAVGGARGGSGHYVYQLGRMGWALRQREGNYWPFRAIHPHTLAIADVLIALREAEQAGRLTVVGFSTEPDCWVTVGREQLKPDLFVEVDVRGRGRRLYWVEVDLGTERQRHLKDKLERYWWAYNNVDSDEWAVFPLVMFLAPDDERQREIAWLIERGKAEARPLFRSVLMPEFVDNIT